MILNFIKNPQVFDSIKGNTLSRCKDLIFVSLILLLSVFIWSLLLMVGSIILHHKGIDILSHITQGQRNLFTENGIYDGFRIILLVPLVEELIFRFPLDLKKHSIILSLITLCIIFVGDKITEFNILNFGTQLKITSIIIILLFGNLLVKQNILNIIIHKYYTLYFYVLAITFSLMHIPNFIKVLPNNLFWICPLLIIPQLFLAMAAGYLRLKNGFIWAVLLHLIYNTPNSIIYVFKSHITLSTLVNTP